MVINGRTLVIGASIGCLVFGPEDEPMPTVRQMHDLADRRMFIAKAAGGGIRMDDGPDAVPLSFAKRRRRTDRGRAAKESPVADTPPTVG